MKIWREAGKSLEAMRKKDQPTIKRTEIGKGGWWKAGDKKSTNKNGSGKKRWAEKEKVPAKRRKCSGRKKINIGTIGRPLGINKRDKQKSLGPNQVAHILNMKTPLLGVQKHIMAASTKNAPG